MNNRFDKNTFDIEQYDNARIMINNDSYIQVLEVVADDNRNREVAYLGNKVELIITNEIRNKIEKLMIEKEVTMYMVFLTLIKILLSRYNLQKDILIRTHQGGKGLSEVKELAGMSKWGVIKNNINHIKSFIYNLGEVRDTLLKVVDNQDKNDKVIQDERNDLIFYIDNNFEHLKIIVVYNNQQYNEETVSRMIGHLENLIINSINVPEQLVHEIDMMSEEERYQLIHEFNNTDRAYPLDHKIYEVFMKQAKKTPQNIAVKCGDEELTYEELDIQSNQVANMLISEGAQCGNVVGILLDRTSNLIVSIFGILKVGCIYLPLDIEYPKDRIEYMIQDSDCSYVIYDNQSIYSKSSKEGTYLNINDKVKYPNEHIHHGETEFLYIIYTSGSTGRPKGSLIKQSSFMNLLLWYKKSFDIGAESSVLLMASPSFDLAQKNLLTPILFGSTLVLFKKADMEYNNISRIILENNISIINTTPSLIYPLIRLNKKNNFKNIQSLKYIILGGESIKIENILPLLTEKHIHTKIINSYGPTECTDISNYYTICSNILEDEDVPIGKSIDNVKTFIVDEHLNIQPIGIQGEIIITGVGVSAGYINDSELSNSRFFRMRAYNNVLAYRTGDIGFYDKYGNIHYVGRRDNQVKIRGNRIELNEINKQIKRCYSVKDVVSLVQKEFDDDIIVSYMITDKEISSDILVNMLELKLPVYMIPNRFVRVDKFPLNPNGKLDLKRLMNLNSPNSTNYEASKSVVTTDTEQKIMVIMAKILKHDIQEVSKSFFDMGGNSLKAIELISSINKEYKTSITVTDIFKNPTVSMMSKVLKNNSKSYNQITKIGQQEYYQCSSSQRRIYAMEQLTEKSIGYNIPIIYRLKGRLDVQKMESVVNQLLNRHEILKANFDDETGNVFYCIAKNRELVIEEAYQENSSEYDYVINNFIRPFDLTKDLLIRVSVLHTKKDESILVFDIHHIIFDGISQSIFFKELSQLYNRQVLERAPELSYADYAQWEIDRTDSDLKKQETYWLKEFSQNIPVMELETDYKKIRKLESIGDEVSIILSQEIKNKLEKFMLDNEVTMYMIFLAVSNILLSRYSSQEELIVGTPVAGRRKQEFKDIIGVFVNTVVIKNTINDKEDFINYVKQVKEKVLEAIDNQDYPFDKLVDKLNINRQVNRNPLFDVMFTYQEECNAFHLYGMDVEKLEYQAQTSKFDISINVKMCAAHIDIKIVYNTQLYKRDTIDRMIRHYRNLVMNFIESPNQPIHDIEMMSEEERNQLMGALNSTEKKYPLQDKVHEVVRRHAKKTPNNIAIKCGDDSLTYEELDQQSNQVANMLVNNGARNSDVVAILLDRTSNLIVSIIGILKAGCTYLPLDIEYPISRIEYMIKDCCCQYVLYDMQMDINMDEIKPLDVRLAWMYDSRFNIVSNNSDAYIIYTSGSTGNPKGVIISHLNLINFSYGIVESLDIKQHHIFLCSTTVSFDIFFLESVMPLMIGATTFIAKRDEQHVPEHIVNIVNNNRINIVQMTPSKLRLIMNDRQDYSWLDKIDKLLIGGEELPTDLAERVIKNSNVDLYNLYGPTEATIWATFNHVNKSHNYNIGKPLPNVKCFIVDKRHSLVPIGVPGELLIAGDNTSVGYLNREQLTNEKFIDTIFYHEKTYMTGDKVKLNADGTIDFIGRMDNQIKYNGYRIELEEIEYTLLQMDKVCDAYVLIFKDELTACIALSESDIELFDIRDYLLKHLPNYMIPNNIVMFDKIPTTLNGKRNRRKLEVILNERALESSIHNTIAPVNNYEEYVYNCFSEILGIDNFSTLASFFSLGGESIKVLTLVTRLSSKYDISVFDIYKYQCVKNIALYLSKKSECRQITKRIDYLLQAQAMHQHMTHENKDMDYISRASQMVSQMIGKRKPYNNILLTGSTGFLGVYLLNELLNRTNNNIYLIIRGETKSQAVDRIHKNYSYYFKSNDLVEYRGRIHYINGDLSKDMFMLDTTTYNRLLSTIDCIINSAAKVKHFGNYEEFYSANVKSVENIIEFAKVNRIDIKHISTMSVGDKHYNNNDYFNEYSNVMPTSYNYYTKSKQHAEYLLNQAQDSGINCTIYRVGNLVPSYGIPKRQMNYTENIFHLFIDNLIKMKKVPNIELDLYDFSFIDTVSRFIISTYDKTQFNESKFHVYNFNKVSMKRLGQVYHLDILNQDMFLEWVTANIQAKEDGIDVGPFLHYFGALETTDFELNRYEHYFTKRVMEELEIEWPKLDEDYYTRYLEMRKSREEDIMKDKLDIEPNANKILMLLLPFWTPLIPPLGISSLKSFLKSHTYDVKTKDLNVYDGIWEIYHQYLNILKGCVPKEKQGNFYNIGNNVLGSHLMAYLNKLNEKEYTHLMKKVIYQHYFIDVNDELIYELEELIIEFYDILEEYTVDIMESEQPSVVGISVYTGTFAPSMFVFELIKRKYEDVVTVMGGGIFSSQLAINSPNFDYFLERSKYIDKIIVGEGENLFLKLLQNSLDTEKKVYTLGDINHAVLDITNAQLPDYTDFDLDKYMLVPSFTSRSCPFQCSFCSETVLWGKYRKKTSKRITNELSILYQKHGYQLFLLSDSLLNPIINSLAHELIDNGLSFYWDGYLRADSEVCNHENTMLWRKAGFYRARLGIESGSQKVLDLMNKKITPDRIKLAISNLAKAGIKTTTYWVIGYPGESEEDFQQTLQIIEDMKDDIYEADCNPFNYYLSGQVGSDEFSKKYNVELLYPEIAKELLITQTWILDCEPNREEIYSRVSRFMAHCKRLGIPNPYSSIEINEADKRWSRLHKNAVPPLLEFKDKNIFISENKTVKKYEPINNIIQDDGEFGF
ncbi:amino acid adenylation domain-containing protein [Vallitalea pronyensis]|uniref:Amino acid adenylation domain-containing protein n=1 Tax=Vallitalea pronyensis TaxID=1348613 RepID=A0A8J8SHW0_9FIRM|nr:non-ribosomal peptide synthetase [Vallitalea pronyensis]QUI23833.1 amino acid adenylation domain-containing protein [Vallitalea pronyensis]